MLTADGCRQRRINLFQTLADDIAGVVITDPQHLVYFANYFPSPYIFRSANARAGLILERAGKATLVVDSMVKVFAEQAIVDEVVAPVWYDGKHSAPQRSMLFTQTLLDRVQASADGHWGIEVSSLPTGVVDGWRGSRPGLRLTGIDATLHQLKRRKLPDEVALFRRSALACDAGHRAGIELIRPGMTELDAFLIVQDAANRALADQALVYGDFVSGPNCEKGGGPPTSRVIQAGDLVLLDFSVIVRGYRADDCNAFVCGGRANNRQVAMWKACVEAIAAGEKHLRPGAVCSTIDAVVRGVLEQHGMNQYFHSHVGHGLGLGHPDPPYIVPNSTDQLLEGDIVTLEPGVFIPGVGGVRYEHNYLITPAGFEQLTHHPLAIDADHQA